MDNPGAGYHKLSPRAYRSLSVLLLVTLCTSTILCCVSCGNKGGGFKNYKGKVENPPSEIESLQVVFAGDQIAEVKPNGEFDFKGRDESTALLRVTDDSNQTTMEAICPKSDVLPTEIARIDWTTSAVSLVFKRPGITTTEPVAAEVLTRLIEKMPQTEDLAKTLESKSKENPAIVSNPDEEILGLVADIAGTVKSLADQEAGGVSGGGFYEVVPANYSRGCGNSSQSLARATNFPPITGGGDDTNNEYFRDANGVPEDGVDVECKYDGEGDEAGYKGINYYNRWVAVYLDTLDEQLEPTMPPEGEPDIPLVLLEPRNTELIPTISTLVEIILVDNVMGIVEDMVKEKSIPATDEAIDDMAKKMLDRTKENFRNLYFPTERDFQAKISREDEYLLSTHGPGLAGETEFGRRDIIPALYTAVTEGIIPLVGLAVDVPDFKPILRETPAMARLAVRYETQLTQLLRESQPPADRNTVGYKWAAFADELMFDPDFQAILAGVYDVGKDVIAKVIAKGIVTLVPPLEAYNKVANAANLVVGYVALAVTIATLHGNDQYYFSPSGNVAELCRSREQKQPQEQLEAGGPIETLKAFFSALEGGRNDEAVSYLYAGSDGQRILYWGAIGLANIIGEFRFENMQYVELSNDGASAQVSVNGNIYYGDRLGISSAEFLIAGTAELAVQDNAWKILVLPGYTETMSPTKPDIELPDLPDIPEYPRTPFGIQEMILF